MDSQLIGALRKCVGPLGSCTPPCTLSALENASAFATRCGPLPTCAEGQAAALEDAPPRLTLCRPPGQRATPNRRSSPHARARSKGHHYAAAATPTPGSSRAGTFPSA